MSNIDNENLEIIRDFVAESRDILESLDPSLMRLEKQMEIGEEIDRDVIHDIFRGFHSIKGAAGFLKMDNIAGLTHQAESMLDLFRKGKAVINQTQVELLYRGGDLLKEMFAVVEENLNDHGTEAAMSELVDGFIAAMPKTQKQVANNKQPSTIEIELNEADRKAIATEAIRMIDAAINLLETAVSEAKSDRELLAATSRELIGIHSHLTLLGLSEMGIATHRMSAILDRLQENPQKDHKNLVAIMIRLLNGLRHCAEDPSTGQQQDATLPLISLMEELDILESSGGMSEEGEVLLGETLVNLGVINRGTLQRALRAQQKPLGEILLNMNAIAKEELEVGLKVQSLKKQEQVSKRGSKDNMVQSIRVDLNKLDLLGNLVGELVIAENMVTHHESVLGEGFESFHKSAQVLNRISREMQDLVMSLRMVPIQATFQKLTRVIRDASHKLGKKVELTLKGEETEIDKNVVEHLSSPLIHIIRNAIDHGLEDAETRIKAGKPEHGSIFLEASQEGGEIVIRVRDDGGGINKAVILQKAIERGLVDREQDFKNDSEIFDLIMLPGFSTATQVTELSGRGVGLDVVKQNIESLQGTISISSEEGVGTVFALRIPLTLSIIEGMLVRVGKAVITIPLLNIRESLVCEGRRVTQAVDGSETIKIRDELIPIIRLSEYFHFPGEFDDLNDGILVVVEYGKKSCCLFVDEILGQRQTVIKRVSNFFGEVSGVTGFSILSNGEITMILDVSQITA